MQKLFEVRHPRVKEYESLKNLWLKCFNDSPDVVERFFESAVTPENVVVAFQDNEAVSVLYMIESTVTNNGMDYKGLYIYAVCTHPDFRGKGLMKSCFELLFEVAKKRGFDYLFLVPAEKNLFTMYERLGFKNGFSYSQRKVYSKDYTSQNISAEELAFEDYIKIRKSFSKEINLATLDENGFKAFLSPEGETVKVFKLGDGYGVYENDGGVVTVHELFGDEENIIQCIFNLTKADSLTLRSTAYQGNSEPFGMCLTIGDAPHIENAFLGIPYGG